MTNGNHFLMNSGIWTIAVSNYMKNAGKAIQIQPFRDEEGPSLNVPGRPTEHTGKRPAPEPGKTLSSFKAPPMEEMRNKKNRRR